MKENIYIKALEIGYQHSTTGISFNEVVDELGIKESLSDEMFKFNFIIWFYSNFYHKSAEHRIVMNSGVGLGVPSSEDIEFNINKLDEYVSEKAYIKGESIQKYNEYLELKEARESSQTAKMFSILSIIIASIAIITPYVVNKFNPDPPKQVIVTENRDKTDDALVIKRLTKIDSTINSAINELSLIADKKVEVPDKRIKSKSKPMKN